MTSCRRAETRWLTLNTLDAAFGGSTEVVNILIEAEATDVLEPCSTCKTCVSPSRTTGAGL